MYCENCGNQISDTARFCGGCGNSVSPPPGSASGVPTPPVGHQSPPAAYAPPPPPPPVAQVPPPPPTAVPPFVPPAATAAPPAWPPSPTPSPGANPGISPALADALVPPNLHWLVVLILSAITYGLGALVWSFKEALFVKKLDPQSKGVTYLVISTVAMVVQVVLAIVMSGSISGEGDTILFVVMIGTTNLVILVFFYLAIFGMRASLVRHYNTVEPIGLHLGGVMTFFFSIIYFQYHFSRIADWKKTGTLR